MSRNKDFINNVIETFENVTKKPEIFLSVQNNKSSQIRGLIKNVYDFTKNNEDSSVKVDALPELITQDFDEEQIWQQIELQNNGRWIRFLTDVSKHVTNRDNLIFPVQIDEDNNDKDEVYSETSEDSNEEDEEDLENDKENGFESDNDSGESTHENSNGDSRRKQKKSSIVDDKFFNLNDLEKFLDMEDRKAMQGDKPKSWTNDDDDDSDESVDLFNGMDDEDMLDDEDEEALIDNEEEQHLRNPKFKDFFDPPDDSITETDNTNKKRKKRDDDSDHSGLELEDVDSDEAERDENEKKRVRFNMSINYKSDNEGSEPEPEPDIAEPEDSGPKSTYEIRQERLSKKIGHLEKAALAEKSWQLKGEVNALKRPENSLLEEIVEFDLTSRPAPVITEETTLRLEDIIKQRIKDKAWDDVERKAKPVDTITEYKKKLVLDQEKSKDSLAQIYEKEYIKQQEALDPDAADKPKEEPKEHIEIREMMRTLFSQLDALSNFHYTPKTAAPELRIVTNLPAISMEEVAPVATTDAAMLAPEQIKSKTKGDILGKDERTATDKKRERRQKKIKQKVRAKEREEKEQLKESQPGGNKFNKKNAKRLLDKVTKNRNTEKMEIAGDGKAMKSSTAFFSQLQDQVISHINSKKTEITKSKKQKKYSY